MQETYFDVDEALLHDKIREGAHPVIKIEQINRKCTLSNAKITMQFLHISQPDTTRGLVYYNFFALRIFTKLTMPAT